MATTRAGNIFAEVTEASCETFGFFISRDPSVVLGYTLVLSEL